MINRVCVAAVGVGALVVIPVVAGADAAAASAADPVSQRQSRRYSYDICQNTTVKIDGRSLGYDPKVHAVVTSVDLTAIPSECANRVIDLRAKDRAGNYLGGAHVQLSPEQVESGRVRVDLHGDLHGPVSAEALTSFSINSQD